MKKLGLIFIILFSVNLTAQSVRPIRDHVGFCWTKSEVEKVMTYLDNDSSKYKNLSGKNLVAGISPHDDYLYAGRVYFPLYRLIKAKEVVIFGVTHGAVRRALHDPKNVLLLDNFDYWRGPYGNVKTSSLREAIKEKLNPDFFKTSDEAHTIEHSIEALIPFLQYYNRDVKITPIMVTDIPFERMDKISSQLSMIFLSYIKKNNLKLGKDIFFLISNDADHYGKDFNNAPFGVNKKAHDKAVSMDREIAEKYIGAEINKTDLKNLTKAIWPNKEKIIPLWCGRYPIVFGLLTITKTVNGLGKKLKGKLFKYSDSRSEWVLPIKNTNLGTTAPFSYEHWCGFFSAGFYAE